MIIKNLDYLFQNVFTESKASQKQSSNFQTEFELSFYNKARRNKINQMRALKMAWYSLIFIHKTTSKAMIFECLMILDYLSSEVEL